MEHPAGGGGGGPTWPDAPPEAPPTLEWPAGSPPGRPPPLPPAPAVEPSRPGGGARTAIGVVLLVVAGLSAALAVAAAAARHELRSSDTWEATSRALAEDPDVQRDVASALAEQVVAAVGVEDRLRGVLPGPLGSLADPVAERTVELVGEATLRLVRTEAFQDAWAAAVRNSHEELLAAFDGPVHEVVSAHLGKDRPDLVPARVCAPNSPAWIRPWPPSIERTSRSKAPCRAAGFSNEMNRAFD